MITPGAVLHIPAAGVRIEKRKTAGELLGVDTPILRPAIRWNHAWAIARAQAGLEPFARGLRAAAAGGAATIARR